MGFLLTRRWLGFAVVVVALAWLAGLLGQWQFHRLEERKHDNGVVSRNLAALPVPVGDVLSTERSPSPDQEWRRVTVRGTWDDRHTVVLKYQTRDAGPGVDVVTPLVTASGTAVLVDRGWLRTTNSGATRPTLPPATDGQVTVTGYVRRDATGSATRVSDLSTRAVSSRTIAPVLPYPVVRGFVDLAVQSPAPERRLAVAELPDDTSNGPHFFYGLQWWFFAALAVGGFCYLVYDEFRRRRRARRLDGRGPGPGPTGTPAPPASQGGSERPDQPAVHGHHAP